MRDATAICDFPARQESRVARAEPKTVFLIVDSFATDKAEHMPFAGVIRTIGSKLFCNAAKTFGKKWETVCVFGTKATKSKTRKEIKL